MQRLLGGRGGGCADHLLGRYCWCCCPVFGGCCHCVRVCECTVRALQAVDSAGGTAGRQQLAVCMGSQPRLAGLACGHQGGTSSGPLLPLSPPLGGVGTSPWCPAPAPLPSLRCNAGVGLPDRAAEEGPALPGGGAVHDARHCGAVRGLLQRQRAAGLGEPGRVGAWVGPRAVLPIAVGCRMLCWARSTAEEAVEGKRACSSRGTLQRGCSQAASKGALNPTAARLGMARMPTVLVVCRPKFLT